jgi:hypothetical protein
MCRIRYVCGRCVVTIGDPEVQYQHTLATHVEEFLSWCGRAGLIFEIAGECEINRVVGV